MTKTTEAKWRRGADITSAPERIEARVSAGSHEGSKSISSRSLPRGCFAIMVNAYERNPAARRVCIAHWGLRCSACSLLMSERYGPRAADLIHVHHLDPLALADGDRAVDPIRDLRPVCPNCHAVMHLGDPPLAIEQVQAMLRRSW